MKYLFLTLLLYIYIPARAQNIGIGTTSPTAKLDINGDLILKSKAISLTTSVTYDLDVNTSRFNHYRITGPAGNFVISGIRTGMQDRMVTLYNRSGGSMQLYNEDIVNPTPNYRITTGIGSNLDIYNGGSVTLKYDTSIMRWEVVGGHASSLNYYGATWGLYGNSGNNLNAFLGTSDAEPLRFGVNNGSAGILDSARSNTALGVATLRSLSSAVYNVNNVALGQYALQNAQVSSGTVAVGFESMKNFTGQNFPAGTLGAFHNTAVGFQSLYANDGISNTAIGGSALRNNMSGSWNTALGDWALLNNRTGSANTALGNQALYSDTSGSSNIAVGIYALKNNLKGNGNVAIGNSALGNNTSISNLVAIGDSALFSNGVGNNAGFATGNTAIGSKTLLSNTNGYENTAIGFECLKKNNSGNSNTGIGFYALKNNFNGIGNTALGHSSLFNNTSGQSNIAIGIGAMFKNTEGGDNIANGYFALNNNNSSGNIGIGTQTLNNNVFGYENVAVGKMSLFSSNGGNLNTAIGAYTNVATPGLSNATAIGALAQVGCSNCMVLGSANGVNSATSGIKVAIGLTTPLVDFHIKQTNETYPVNGGGIRLERLTNTDHWDIGTDNTSDFDFALNGSAKAYINHVSGAYTVASDFRLKKDITTIGTVLPAIMQLQPKTYHYKDNQSSDPLSYGFIAQEVEQLFPAFVTTKGPDGTKAIAYQNFDVVAIKAIQELQNELEILQRINKDLLKRLEKLEIK